MTGLVGPWLGGLRRRSLVVGPWVGGFVVGHLARVWVAWMGVAWMGSLGLVVLGSNARPQPRLQASSSTPRWLSHGANPRHRHADSHGPTLRHRHGPHLRHRHVNPHVPPLRPCEPSCDRVLSIVLAISHQPLCLLLCLRVQWGTVVFFLVSREQRPALPRCGVPAEVVWGTVVDSREQRPALPRQDRTRGVQRDHRS